ncbi:transposase, partial [Microbacterium aurantiacum]|uniref:transposase n=1 Tax=Microbacterium aurantiacum TaxID=162393 RepID=UPI004035E5EA
NSEFTDVTTRLGCLRGISTLTGFALAVEIGDWHRLTGASIAAYLGLVPSEHSSGGTRSLGPITKTGNTHARRLLIESAWYHKHDYRPGKILHHRWMVLAAKHKKHTVANTAIARELAGWCWSLAVMD